MAVIQVTYEEVRSRMQPRDVIAFGGKGNFSEIIKFATASSVSHVGVILQTKITNDPSNRFFNQIIESGNINGFNGVNISRFSDCLQNYDGEMWWLPLNEQTRAKLDQVKFYNFLFDQAQKRVTYDLACRNSSIYRFNKSRSVVLHHESKIQFENASCSIQRVCHNSGSDRLKIAGRVPFFASSNSF